jgi:predicted transcriptional regulator
MSQVKPAKALGIAQAVVNRYEHNTGAIPDNVLFKYAEYFDVSLE